MAARNHGWRAGTSDSRSEIRRSDVREEGRGGVGRSVGRSGGREVGRRRGGGAAVFLPHLFYPDPPAGLAWLYVSWRIGHPLRSKVKVTLRIGRRYNVLRSIGSIFMELGRRSRPDLRRGTMGSFQSGSGALLTGSRVLGPSGRAALRLRLVHPADQDPGVQAPRGVEAGGRPPALSGRRPRAARTLSHRPRERSPGAP